MLKGLLGLTWLEIKIFVREPLGLFATVGVPVLMFLVLGRVLGSRVATSDPEIPRFISADLPILMALLIATNAVVSLVAIMAIYREGGILKRLRATPLRPHTILTAHVLVKLLLTVSTLALMVLAGRRSYPLPADVPLLSFAVALLLGTMAFLSFGFLIAAIVPTARFAQPIATIVLYPMFGLCGLLVPIDVLPPALQAVSRIVPLTYMVAMLRGIWHGEGWANHLGDVTVLALMFLVCTVASARVFRWE